MTNVSADVAESILGAAEEKASEIEVPMCIAVFDEGANLVAFRRMDDALLASIDIAQNKAYSAVSLKMPTHELANASQPNESLFGIHSTNDDRIVIFGGGYPLRVDGDVVGAVGVSGGAVEEDRTVAEAGVEAFES
ncbi:MULTISPECIES: heme-binding protein [unclassified Haladaptatus]|nr:MULTISPECIES: heme-binding protein [unclassified Haladaptatus]MCO8244864.1 heme-binding protein [Haladaptatus sp. AB643]MCO8255623.1 heme-binding protein [Haladaptatus sp. AB618]